MGQGVPEARRQCYNSPMNSDLSGPTTTAEVICQDYCQNAVSRSDPLQGSDKNRDKMKSGSNDP